MGGEQAWSDAPRPRTAQVNRYDVLMCDRASLIPTRSVRVYLEDMSHPSTFESSQPDPRSPAVTPRRPMRKRAAYVALALFFVGAEVLWVVHDRSTTEDALTAVPDVERRALYERTMETLRTTCAEPIAPDLVEFCHEQADIAAALPECDATCESHVARLVPRPTR